MSQPDPAKVRQWHRWFAVELNNRSWDLAEQENRTAEEEAEMLSAAYCARFHWSKVGTAENACRAAVLLSHVHSLLGRGDDALTHARESLVMCEQHGFDDWDLASAHIAMARAAAVANERTLHEQYLSLAAESVKAIREDEDRSIMADLLASVPRHIN